MSSLAPILEALGISEGAASSGAGILFISLAATFILGIVGALLGEQLRNAAITAVKANWITLIIWMIWAAASVALINEYGRWIPALLAGIPLLIHFLTWKFHRVTLQKKILPRVSVDVALLASMFAIFPAAFTIEHLIIKHRYKVFGDQAVVSLLLPPRVNAAATARQFDPTAANAFFSALRLDLRLPLEGDPYSSYLFVGPEDARDNLFLKLCEALKDLSLVGAPPARYLVDYSDESETPIEIVFTSVIQPLENQIDQLHVNARVLDRVSVRLNVENDIDLFVNGEILGNDDERHRVSLIAAYRLVQFLEKTFTSLSADKVDFNPMWRKIGDQVVDFAALYASNNKSSPKERMAQISADAAAFVAQNPDCHDQKCVEQLVGILDSFYLSAGDGEEHEIAKTSAEIRLTAPASETLQ